jgi:hypothetical protein
MGLEQERIGQQQAQFAQQQLDAPEMARYQSELTQFLADRPVEQARVEATTAQKGLAARESAARVDALNKATANTDAAWNTLVDLKMQEQQQKVARGFKTHVENDLLAQDGRSIQEKLEKFKSHASLLGLNAAEIDNAILKTQSTDDPVEINSILGNISARAAMGYARAIVTGNAQRVEDIGAAFGYATVDDGAGISGGAAADAAADQIPQIPPKPELMGFAQRGLQRLAGSVLSGGARSVLRSLIASRTEDPSDDLMAMRPALARDTMIEGVDERYRMALVNARNAATDQRLSDEQREVAIDDFNAMMTSYNSIMSTVKGVSDKTFDDREKLRKLLASYRAENAKVDEIVSKYGG